MLNIPSHNCKNCGQCCEIVPATKIEIENIKEFVNAMDSEYRIKLKNQKRRVGSCPYRDTEKQACAIYKVRPFICKIFGVAKGMECSHGNSAEIDYNEYARQLGEISIIGNYL